MRAYHENILEQKEPVSGNTRDMKELCVYSVCRQYSTSLNESGWEKMRSLPAPGVFALVKS